MQSLGEVLRALRLKRGWSQERLAMQAQVTARALRYWEANHQQPRDMELENVLKALAVTPQERGQVYALLTDPRTIRLTQSIQSARNVPTALLGPMPGIGDLLRAMRLRRRWTQEQLAEAVGVSRATILRWEATRTLPSDEDIARLCAALQAPSEELAALTARRLLPTTWQPHLSLEECLEQYEMLLQVRNGAGAQISLVDLHTLALKRQIRFLLSQSSEALGLMAKVEVHHGWWLYMQGREAEACAGNWRALNMARGALAPEQFWVMALNLLSAHAAAGGARGPENAVRLLYPWLRLLPSPLHYWLLCDMALYASRSQRPEDAANFLQRAQQCPPPAPSESAKKQWYHDWYYRMTMARVLLNSGKPVDALEWLPVTNPTGDGCLLSLLVWAEMYLAAGEKNQASRYLHEAQALLVEMPLLHRQSKLEQLAQQL